MLTPRGAADADIVEKDPLLCLVLDESAGLALEENEARSTDDRRKGPERGRLLLADPG